MTPRIACPTTIEERENHILQTTAELMEEQGYSALTIDKVVARVPYSKGTVYNHFSSKEDLLVGLCIHKQSELKDLFLRAAAFNGSNRERLLAINTAYFIYALLSPAQAMAVLYIRTADLEAKANPERLEKLFAADIDIMSIDIEVIEQALAAGEFKLPRHMNLQQVAFGTWTTAFGSIALLNSMIESCPISSGLILDQEFFNNVNIMMDGYGFKPLSTEHDVKSSLKRILDEVFAPEVEALQQRGRSLFI